MTGYFLAYPVGFLAFGLTFSVGGELIRSFGLHWLLALVPAILVMILAIAAGVLAWAAITMAVEATERI